MNDELVYSVRDVTRIFGRGQGAVRAVDGVTLELAAGDRLGVVGESGSGKSTLIRMMAGLNHPTSGEIEFQGQRIDQLAERHLGFLRASVQMVFQDPRSSLNPRMRVGDIVTEPLRSPRLRRNTEGSIDRQARLVEVLQQVGLDADMQGRYPHEFSGGQRQRIAIARALCPRPKVLIADEPVSALDVSVQAQVLNLLSDLVAQEGLTMIFVSHDLQVVRHVCDRVAVMRNGRVVELGSTAQVYTEPQQAYTAELVAAIPRITI